MTGEHLAEHVVVSARRSLALARTAQLTLLPAVGFGLAVGTLLGKDWVVWSAIVLAAVWVFLVLRSVRVVAQVREGFAALQAGNPDLAESRAREVLASKTMLRPATVSALLVLAWASRESRPGDAAQLAAFVLTRSERLLVGDRESVQLLLAESLLATGHVDAARAAMLPLYAMRLSLADSLRLLLLQLRTEARIGAYESMLNRLGAKVDLVDLMAPRDCALALGLLRLAATRAGFVDLGAWLGRRVKLLANWGDLSGREPVLEGAGEDDARHASG